MLVNVGKTKRPLAMAAFYGAPDECLYERSSKTYVSVPHLRDTGIRVIDIKKIESVVAMVPDHSYGLTHQDGTQDDRWFLMEKPGLKMSSMVGMDECLDE